MSAPPLSGVRVAVHANGVAAAQAGRMLATLGAECLLVEPPEGSALRLEAPMLPGSETSALFAYLTAGMSSVVHDLTTPEGKAAFEQAKIDYKWAMEAPTNNSSSSGITFRHTSEDDNKTANKFVHESIKEVNLR